MKTPPFSLFPLRALHAAEPDVPHKRFPSPPQGPTHWLRTVMDSTGGSSSSSNNQHHEDVPPRHHKASLAFILDHNDDDHGASGSETESDHELTAPLPPPASIAKRRRVSLTALASPREEATPRPQSPDAKKGSKFCIVDGCTSRAKHARRCWRHGGSVKCKVQDCINRAKSKGVCWSHGGGTICSQDDCETIAVSHGFCWAHGGGKRCQVDGCSRPAYERTNNLCTTHHKQRVRGGATAAAARR